jgi:hypothetical protein
MPTYYDAFTYNCTPEVFNGEIIKSVDSEGDTIYFFQSNLRAVSDIQSNVSGYFGTIHLINTYRGYQYRNSTGTQWIFDTQNTYVLDIPEDSTSALMKVVNWNLSDPDPDYTFTDNTRQLLKDDAKRYTIRDNFRTFFMFNKNNEVGNIWYPCGTTGSGVNPNPFNYLDWGYNATIDWTDNAWVISSFNPHCSFGNAGIPPSWVRNIRDCHNPSVSPEYNIR